MNFYDWGRHNARDDTGVVRNKLKTNCPGCGARLPRDRLDYWHLALTTLNTILLSGPLLLNSFIDPDTFGKSCITFKPLNLDQKHVISK